MVWTRNPNLPKVLRGFIENLNGGVMNLLRSFVNNKSLERFDKIFTLIRRSFFSVWRVVLSNYHFQRMICNKYFSTKLRWKLFLAYHSMKKVSVTFLQFQKSSLSQKRPFCQYFSKILFWYPCSCISIKINGMKLCGSIGIELRSEVFGTSYL